MTDDTMPPKASYRNSDDAAFVYFDNAPAYGVLMGAIQVELSANVLLPVAKDGGIAVQEVVTAHLRCSPAAALALRTALGKALEMIQNSQNAPPQGSGSSAVN